MLETGVNIVIETPDGKIYLNVRSAGKKITFKSKFDYFILDIHFVFSCCTN